MSIITTAQAVPSRLFTLYACLVGRPDGESRDKLEAWCTPSSLTSRGSQDDDGEATTTLFVNTLNEAKRLGLVTETDGRLRLNPDARPRGAGVELEDVFRAFVLSIVLDTGKAAEAQQDGFMLALSWFLSKSPFVGIAFADAPQNTLKVDLGEDNYRRTELTSINRFQNFLYWSWFLGFASFTGGGRDAGEGKDVRYVIPDPIKAIERVLPAIFAGEVTLAADVFVRRLANIFPVFEGGTAREEVEAWTQRPVYAEERRVSVATSFAFQRLKTHKLITFDSESDAAPVFLDMGGREERVTIVKLAGIQ